MPASAAKPKKRKPRQPRGLNREQAHDLMARLAQDRPNPKTELDYTNPYTLLVARAGPAAHVWQPEGQPSASSNGELEQRSGGESRGGRSDGGGLGRG